MHGRGGYRRSGQGRLAARMVGCYGVGREGSGAGAVVLLGVDGCDEVASPSAEGAGDVDTLIIGPELGLESRDVEADLRRAVLD